ncbi:MAG TPA: EAL domain-containing protein, partial [Acholeplasma sp.]|nr:EAL domain-containing protein [Acholeplasma sp.]
ALMGHNFVSLMETLVLETKADPKRIELEITETAIITDIKESIRVLNLLKKMGFVISIDDFGTGYSSLSYLNKLPVDILKIDRTFINNITEVGTSPVVEFMVNIASQLKLDVIVEGVETIKQRDIVKEYGCKYAQGYLYSKPLSITDLIDYIKNEKKGQNN